MKTTVAIFILLVSLASCQEDEPDMRPAQLSVSVFETQELSNQEIINVPIFFRVMIFRNDDLDLTIRSVDDLAIGQAYDSTTAQLYDAILIENVPVVFTGEFKAGRYFVLVQTFEHLLRDYSYTSVELNPGDSLSLVKVFGLDAIRWGYDEWE